MFFLIILVFLLINLARMLIKIMQNFSRHFPQKMRKQKNLKKNVHLPIFIAVLLFYIIFQNFFVFFVGQNKFNLNTIKNLWKQINTKWHRFEVIKNLFSLYFLLTLEKIGWGNEYWLEIIEFFDGIL